MIMAKTTRNVMSPGRCRGSSRRSRRSRAATPACSASASRRCPPDQGPGLHVHYHTHETFMALTGRWEIQWGDAGEESIVLEPFDLIAMPPRVTRRFINRSSEDAHLMVIIQGQREEFDDVDRVPATSQAIAEKYGQGMVDKLETLGWKFTIGIEHEAA